MNTVTLATPIRSRRTIHFLRHLGEMTAAMFLGMGALAAAFAAAGRSLLDFRLAHPEAAVVAMVAAMTVPMVAWTRRRGHDWESAGEMSVAMAVPAVIALTCYWLGALPAEPLCPVMCVGMIPAMAIAMFFRLDQYTRHVSAARAVALR
jgi:hypothetical protein